MAGGALATATEIGAATLQGVELLQQQAVEAQVFWLKDIESAYCEGIPPME